MARDTDAVFTGSIAELYERALVPLIFSDYAEETARRVAALSPENVLEVAAGTGVVTRALARATDAAITATDLNQPMLDHAATVGTAREVTWRQADALALPFADASYDVVVCQFGVMFFPDRVRGWAEARRVLRPGGTLVVTVWDSLAANELPDETQRTLGRLWPEDPPRFLERTPYGYHDPAVLRADAVAGGFGGAEVDAVSARARAATAREAAIAFVQGTTLRNEIEPRSATALAEATDAAAEAFAARFGASDLDTAIRAVYATASA
ncbi:MAG TPA: class I SAM-dependent methyltransferase [Frankiaceae bacterium]|nr:class I SAM-dependent methyltransferase [Frankiaceae bacterium]